MNTNPNPSSATEPGDGDVVWILEDPPTQPSPETAARIQRLLLDARSTGVEIRLTKQQQRMAGLQYPTMEAWEAAQRGELDPAVYFATTVYRPPYVIRVQRRDGAATLGVLRDREHDEAAVYDPADLLARLAAAADHPELIISFRAGNSDRWIVAAPADAED